MQGEKEEDNLHTLKEMLLDERRLVTYISLSKELCVHVNESKALLTEIVDALRKKDENIELNVHFIISGLVEDYKASTIVCDESQLASLQNRFKAVFFKHVYSVSVGKSSIDNLSHLSVSNFDDLTLCTGLIKSNICIKRTADEIGILKTNSQEIVVSEQKQGNTLTQKKTKVENKNSLNNIKVAKIQETKSEPIIKTEVISPKKDLSNNGSSKSDMKNLKTQKGIAGFFNKAASAPVKKSSTEVKENGPSKIVKLEKQVQKVNGQSKDFKLEKVVQKETVPENSEKMDIDEEIEKEKIKTYDIKVDLNQKSKKSSLSQIKKTAKVDKKRKRVLRVSDSESDDEANDPFVQELKVEEDSDDEIPPTPTVPTVKITSGIINPKKKRKIVDKTYTDEDGYILTKKEEVYESCSENEEEVNVKENIQQVNKQEKTEVSPKEKKNGNKNKKKNLSPQKGKQATLMSFFKKV